jgi:hypothetical protein
MFASGATISGGSTPGAEASALSVPAAVVTA